MNTNLKELPVTPVLSSQRAEHLIALSVAVGLVALSLADGGYGAEIRSALTVLIWAAVIAGLLSGRFPRAEVPSAALIAGCSLAAVALLSGISISWASDDGRAFTEAIRVAGYLGLFTAVVCASGREGARPWLVGLALGIIGVGLLAVGSRLIPALPGGDEEIAAFLPNATGRLSYPLGYWNGLGALFAIGVVMLAWLSVEASRAQARAIAVAAIPLLGLGLYLTSSRGGFAAALVGILLLVVLGPRRLQLLVGVAIGGMGAGLAILVASRQPELLDGLTNHAAKTQGAEVLAVLLGSALAAFALRAVIDTRLSELTLSRPWARAFAAALVGILLLGPRRLSLLVGVAIGGMGAGLAILAAIVGLAVADPNERIEQFKEVPTEENATGTNYVGAHLASGSGSGRYQFWGEALDAYSSEPVHGIGAGGYGAYWTEHATIDGTVQDAHSLFLEVLGELGPLGLIALLVFFAVGAAEAFRRRSESAFFLLDARVCLALLATGVA